MPLVKDLEHRFARLTSLIADVEDARACRDLDEAACTWVPRNFGIILVTSTLTKLGDALSSPKTVLTWVMASVGAPTGLIAMLVPVRESLSMLPQLLLGAWVRRKPLRKPIWLAGSLLQGGAVLGCAAAAAWLEGMAAGWTILACVVVFSLARSLNSLADKDLLGKTIPKGRRGRLGGWAASASGLVTLAIGVWFALRDRSQDDPLFYAGLLALAGATWLVAALIYTAVEETPGETDGGANGWQEAWSRLDLMRTDAPFRRFVITRALLLCSALTSPFYVVLAREHGSGGASLLGTFLVAGGLASSLSAPVWGTMADRSSRQVLTLAALLTGGLGILLFAVMRLAPQWAGTPWLFPVFFFVLGVIHAGVRAGRKTYLVDLAGGVKRTDYVAVSNTLIGLLLLVVGGITSLFAHYPAETVVLGLSLFGLVGAALSRSLPEVQ